ncbi:aryldialkylphosphatase [Curtobacterium sp. MCSS17_015]|uniref:phosphotriesterase family protein n=1 Tax=Curtobacterium sp. MCSS17_015 TaxID=2175666 RepID=UPI000DA75061|nr:aryldialkylphosphatase [Curtobacterium sp. MCSS17_015]WIB25733.1 aryldialkylphosphatase [Curtobacterium sp. MCSS17_015]
MSENRTIRTVTGDRPGESLGAFDYHEHLFQTTPLLAGDELADEDLSGREAASLHTAGIGWMVEATPTGLGADPGAVARISARTGLVVVHTTGAHHGGHYAPGHPLTRRSTTELTSRFVEDVVSGFRRPDGAPVTDPEGAPVRAGLVKAGIRYWSIGTFERRVLDAAAATAVATGCALMVHLDHGSATHEVLDLLDGQGVRPDRVVLAHVDRNLDPGLHASLVERGAYLGYDGMARHREAPDSAILECLATVVDAVGSERLVVGGDVARSSRYRAYGGLPGLDYLPTRFMPRLGQVLSAADVERITEQNGRELLGLRPPS